MARFPQADYCHRDALAMVRVVEKLEGLARLGLNKPNGYLLGSYRIATAPEPNSSRLTSLKLIRFDSPANNVGPWPASLGCTTISYSSVNQRSSTARGSVKTPT